MVTGEAFSSVRFTVVTYGSEGDTRPLVALCRGLEDAGHDVRLFAEASTAGSARAQGIPFDALAGDMQSTLPMNDPSRELSGCDLMRAVKESFRVINGNIESWMRAVAEHARDSDGMLFAGLAFPMARAVAQCLNKPGVGLWLQPTTPTREFPSPILPPLRLPGWMNVLTYRASPQAVIERFYGKATRAARAQIFGMASGSAGADRQYPCVYGFSRHLVRRPRDWPVTHRICGHWPLPPTDWQPPAALLDFLAAGPPPLYVGFGAVSSFVRQKGLTEIAKAIAGRRVLFYPGWSKITADMLPRNFHVLGDTPHTWLFPKTSMVIHHAGGGTTHSAARAGVPSIALPVGADQFFWAGRLAAAGVAPPYIRATRIDAQSLARMIDFAEREDVRARAMALAAAMAEEDGVAVAVELIEALVRPAATSVNG